jgi:hypothetical protein
MRPTHDQPFLNLSGLRPSARRTLAASSTDTSDGMELDRWILTQQGRVAASGATDAGAASVGQVKDASVTLDRGIMASCLPLRYK